LWRVFCFLYTTVIADFSAASFTPCSRTELHI
jgi:hypothetical protein